MRAVWTIAKRELASYFTSPVAYVFLVIFLLLTGFFTFTAGNFFERGEASLAAFFGWHPWVYLVLVPAVFLATRHWSVCSRLCLFAAIAPFAIFLSFPGCFVMGGVLLAMLPELWHERRRPAVWLAYAVTALAALCAFGLLLMGPIRAQHTTSLAGMWTDTFPNWSEPWTVPQ